MRCRSLAQAFTVLLLAFVAAAAVGQARAADPSNPYTEQAPPCIVPALHGKSLRQAKTAIAKGHCKLGVVRKRTAPKALVGKVVSQSPARSKRLKGGALVSITLGRKAP